MRSLGFDSRFSFLEALIACRISRIFVSLSEDTKSDNIGGIEGGAINPGIESLYACSKRDLLLFVRLAKYSSEAALYVVEETLSNH